MAYKKRRWRHIPKKVFPLFSITMTNLLVRSRETKETVEVLCPNITVSGRVGETYTRVWEGDCKGETLKVEFTVDSEKQTVEVADLSVSELYYLGNYELRYTHFHVGKQLAVATVLTKRK
jgi:hypothetical protein